MADALKLILSMSLSGTVLASLLFAVKPLIRHKITKSVQYAAWIVVILRLILPFSIGSGVMDRFNFNQNTAQSNKVQIPTNSSYDPPVDINNANINENYFEGGSSANVSNEWNSHPTGSHTSTDSITSTDSNTAKGNLLQYFDKAIPYLFLLWILGAILAFSHNLYNYICFISRIKRTHLKADTEETEALNSLQQKHRFTIFRNISVVRNPFIHTPMTIGIFKPCIILPDRVFSETQLQNILLHELIHVRRFDVAVKWLIMIVSSVHWFNPFLICISKEINRICEMACDEAVIRNFSRNEKQNYGDTLIAIVSGGKNSFGVLQADMNGDKKTLKARLTAIMKHEKKSKTVIVLSGILLVSVIIAAIAIGAGCGIGDYKPSTLNDSPEFNDAEENHKNITPDEPLDNSTEDLENDPTDTPVTDPYFSAKIEPYSILTAHIKSMEGLLQSGSFTDMSQELTDSIMSQLPDIIRENYVGIGRLVEIAGGQAANKSGYLLLTSKDESNPFPEGTTMYSISPGGTTMEQIILEDDQRNEICRFPLGMNVQYFNKYYSFYITYMEDPDSVKPLSLKQIENIVRYEMSLDSEYISYARNAKLRGSSILWPQDYPYISVDLFTNGRRWSESISVDPFQTQAYKDKLVNADVISINSEKIRHTGISIWFGEDDQYTLCYLDDGTEVMVKWSDARKAVADPQLFRSIIGIAEEKTRWEWIELSEIHDLVWAEFRIKPAQDMDAEVQEVVDENSLKELEELFSGAEYTGVSGCPYTAQLRLMRNDGKVITLQIATDSCDSMILGSYAGYDYGPQPLGDGQEGTVSKQEVLKRIFDKVNWSR